MDHIRCERGEDGVFHLRLDRPDKLNALHPELMGEVIEAQRSLEEDPEMKVVLLSGAGRSFCAGADLTHSLSIADDPPGQREHLRCLRDMIVGFERLAQPVVCAVHGHVLAGGLELALGCDIIVAARSARIGDQHMRAGLIPGGGDTQRIPRLLGKAQALDLLLTGRWLSAEEAARIGLISRVADDEELMADAAALAAELAAMSFTALREVKRLTHLAYSTPLEQGLELEIDASIRYFNSPELRTALTSFDQRAR